MSLREYYVNQIQMAEERRALNDLYMHPFRNRGAIQAMHSKIQALSESARSILTTAITQFMTAAQTPDKNKYKDYASQVTAAYAMYKASADFGGDLFGGCLDMRVAMIAGEGVSLSAEKKETQDYLELFAEKNGLQGSRLIRMIETGELEGKNLIRLIPTVTDEKKREGYVKMQSFPWQVFKYKVETIPGDYEVPSRITYNDGNKDDKTIDPSKSVYVRLGGTEADVNETTNRLHRILTDFEGLSRAKYDLNKNMRLFGKIIPTWETKDRRDDARIKRRVQSSDFDIGKGFVGQAVMKLLEPSGEAADAIKELILLYLKIISTTTGIPVHMLAWPELMSNRATADTLTDVIFAATKKERLIWEEKIHEAIEKSMDIAIDAGFAKNEIKNTFTVQLPFVSIELLQKMVEVLMPLVDDEIISMKTLRDVLPFGLNPMKETAQIKKEKKERAKSSPANNETVDETVKGIQDGNQATTTQGEKNPGDALTR